MPLAINIRVLEARSVSGRELHHLRERELCLQIEIVGRARHDADRKPEPMRLHSSERNCPAEAPAVRRDIAHGMADHDEVGRYRAVGRRRHLRGETETWRASPSPTLAVE